METKQNVLETLVQKLEVRNDIQSKVRFDLDQQQIARTIRYEGKAC